MGIDSLVVWENVPLKFCMRYYGLFQSQNFCFVCEGSVEQEIVKTPSGFVQTMKVFL